MEAYLTAAQRDELGRLLDRMRTAIEADLGRDEAGRRKLEMQLDRIRAARGRLVAGTYGECLACGGSIGYARLLARPELLRCGACHPA